jgi:hypothetical protein
VNRRIDDLTADAAAEIYNLAIIAADKPTRERFAMIVGIVHRVVAEALQEQRGRILRNSEN